MDMDNNRLIVGPEEELFSGGLAARDFNWIGGVPASGEKVTAKIRYMHPGVASEVSLTGEGSVRVRFSSPEKAVTPGQAVVIYRGEEVLGGGWIKGAFN
jgi:tRNA-specific 2-thiouridylase